MAREVFVDTSGFYALLVRADPRHEAAAQVMQRARKRKAARPQPIALF
ncbi:MAG: hypothetical protein MJD61_08500 [Proteobacteria bacterium]|nr:hypothetical protein [Pseudomonadota bacterium]